MNSAIYFDTWAAPWTSNPYETDLAKLDVSVINLAFVDPKTTYKGGQLSFENTGLQFSWDFEIVRKAIDLAKKKGIKVMLSVGGASYPFDHYNPGNVAALAFDLGCSGIDIDWESSQGKGEELSNILIRTKQYSQGFLSFAGWSVGCFPKTPTNLYQGMNLDAIKNCYNIIDWINIMAYDAGANFDVKKCYESYKNLFSKQLYLGFEVGTQGWGDGKLKLQDIDYACTWLKPGDGCFVWAWHKSGDPNCKQVLERFKNNQTIPQPPKELNFSFKCTCTNCGKALQFGDIV